MKQLIAIWNYLDGKKTNIGAGIATFVGLVSAFNSVVLMGYWHLSGIPYMDQSCLTLMWVAALFGGTGLVHQVAKNKAAIATPAAAADIK